MRGESFRDKQRHKHNQYLFKIDLKDQIVLYKRIMLEL